MELRSLSARNRHKKATDLAGNKAFFATSLTATTNSTATTTTVADGALKCRHRRRLAGKDADTAGKMARRSDAENCFSNNPLISSASSSSSSSFSPASSSSSILSASSPSHLSSPQQHPFNILQDSSASPVPHLLQSVVASHRRPSASASASTLRRRISGRPRLQLPLTTTRSTALLLLLSTTTLMLLLSAIPMATAGGNFLSMFAAQNSVVKDPCYSAAGKPVKCVPDFVNAAFGKTVQVGCVCIRKCVADFHVTIASWFRRAWDF